MDSVSRVAIVYAGRFADDHVLDGQEMGLSLAGASRTYALIAHTALTGNVPGKRTTPAVRCYVGPPREGSVGTDILITLVQAGVASGSLALPMDGIKAAVDVLIARISEALVGLWTGRNEDVEKALEVIAQQSAQQHELAKVLANGLISQGQDAMSALHIAVEKLGDAARSSARDMVAPVGNSCTGATHSISGRSDLVVAYDMATAEALRQDGATIGNAEVHVARVSAVDKTNGRCKFEIEGMTHPIKATIADPAIKLPGNLYTHALDTNDFLLITAKPVLDRNGDVKEFFIMDAKRRVA